LWLIPDDGLREGILREAWMGTDSRKDSDKDRRTPGHNDGSDTLRRIEVITGTGRRRRWDAETKARLVAESFEPGCSVSEVARRHDISPSLLFLWRRQAAEAAKNAESNLPDGLALIPMVVAGEAPAAPVENEACVIEVELGDVRIRIKGSVDRSVLREVFLAARTTR
jgi:transposase